MSDDIWIKVKSSLPRPTSEDHTRPLRHFAWSDYAKPVTAAQVAEGAKAVDKLRGNQPNVRNYVEGSDTPEANEHFWEAAREQFGDEPIDGEPEPERYISPHSYGRAIDVKKKP